jgi:GntR family transcriptional regulator
MSISPASTMRGQVYRRVCDALRREIENGRFDGSEVLPGERELATMLDVSRTTLRRAIGELVEEGLLVHRHGAGTFIRRAAPRLEQPLSRLTGFTEDMRSRGFAASSQILERGLSLPTPEEAMMLALSPSEGVLRLSRLRLADDVPMAIENAVVPQKFLPDPEKIGSSLYSAMEAEGFRPVRALQRLRATLLSEQVATQLGVPKKSAALYIQRLGYIADGRCVEFTRSYYRGDTYDFVSELTLPATPRKAGV